MTRRAFTVEAANAALPHVRATFRRVRTGRDAARRRADKIAVLDALWGDAILDVSNPDHGELLAHRQALIRIRRALEHLIEDRLTGQGIRVPPGALEHGLVDFPSTLGGRWIFLGWQAGESEVRYWHEIDGGFAGRTPITDELATRIGLAGDPALEDDSALDFS